MGVSQKELADLFDISIQAIHHIKNGQNWSWLPEAYPKSIKAVNKLRED